MGLTEEQLHRYARHIILPEIGGKGQERLLACRVLVIGAGGLGAPVLLYLAASGIGTLGIIDPDHVDLSNLHRQIIHDSTGIGSPKTDSAARAIARINPACHIETHDTAFGEATASLAGEYDLVIDGSDNFATRYLAADKCAMAGTPLVSASILRFEAQISLFKPYLAGDYPCYRCLFPEPPPPELTPSCALAGVLGPLCGLAGSLQAIEAVKELLGLGEGMSGRLLLIDALRGSFREIRVHRDPSCVCADLPRRYGQNQPGGLP